MAARVIFSSLRDFFRDGGPVMAAALAFFATTALVPASMFIISLMGYLLGEYEGFHRFFLSKLSAFFPEATEKMAGQIEELLHFERVGRLSIIAYIALSFGLYHTMETAVNAMFKIKKKRNFLVSLFLGLLVITAIAVFLLVSFVFTLHEPLLSFFGGVLKWPKIAGIYEVLLKYVVPFVLVLSASVVVYIILPVARVRLSCAFWGGLFTSSMLEIAKHAFTFYVKKAVPVIGAVYGPLTAFFVFLMWIFYSCCIFLIGGEIVHNLGESKVARAGGVKRRA